MIAVKKRLDIGVTFSFEVDEAEARAFAFIHHYKPAILEAMGNVVGNERFSEHVNGINSLFDTFGVVVKPTLRKIDELRNSIESGVL